MRRGKRFVVAGFVLAVAGTFGYAGPGPDWLAVPGLATIGVGTVLWLIGAFVFLVAATDSDSDDDVRF